MRLKRETGPPARMQEEILRVFAVFFDGLEIMVTGAESKVAQTRPGGGSAPSVEGAGDGSAISSDNWKLFAFAVPVTWRNLKLEVMLLSSGAFCSKERSPISDTTVMESSWRRICHTGPSIWTTGGGHKKRFSLP